MADGHALADGMLLSFELNGASVTADVAPGIRLSRLLRDHFGLTGTKVGCDAGDCGACTVLLAGDPVCSCMVAAAQVAGRPVETIEGLGAANPVTQSLQAAFLRHGAAQ